MDRLSQLRGGAGGSRDVSLDGSTPGDSFLTANDTPSKYYSLSEDDSSFDITKDVSLGTATADPTLNDSDCFSNLSPIGKKDMLDYKIGKQIEAANILSGGVNIFDDNESSYDGNELVIDDNVEISDKSPGLKSPEGPVLPFQDDNVESVDKSPILKLPESSELLLQVDNVESGESSSLKLPENSDILLQVETVESGESSSLKLPENSDITLPDNIVEIGEKSPSLKSPESSDPPLDKVEEQLEERPDQLAQGDDMVIDRPEPPVDQAEEPAENVNLPLENVNLPLENVEEAADGNLAEDVNENRTEVVLQIDGNNVDAINIGTGLYLYRKEGQEELAAVQIVENEEPSFKFLKVRENAEGNLEVYEEIQEVIVVPQETPVREGRPAAPNPTKETNKAVSVPSSSKTVEKKNTPDKEVPVASTSKQDNESVKDPQAESKAELNLNGKMVKFSESRKSPLMAYHSTPNKEGIPLTKTMVDQQLHPNRHSDNIKKTIEVHTDNCKQKNSETPTKSKDVASPDKISEESPQADKPIDKETPSKKHISIVTKEIVPDVIEKKTDEVAQSRKDQSSVQVEQKANVDVTKVSVTGNVEEVVEKEPIIIEEEKKNTVSDKTPENLNETSHTSGSKTRIVDAKSDVKGALNKDNTDKEVKENKVSTTSSLAETPIKIGNLEVKILGDIETKGKPVIMPIEIIESDDMDVDEDALVIEEQIIDSQPDGQIIDNQPEVEESEKQKIRSAETAKPTTLLETKIDIIETSVSCQPSTKDTIRTANLVKTHNINLLKNDKSELKNKSGTGLNTGNSLNIKEGTGTNSKHTHANDNSKTVENKAAKQTTLSKEKITQNVEKVTVNKIMAEIEATAVVESTISIAKVNDTVPVNNLHNRSENINSKLELTDKKTEKKEDLTVTNLKDVETIPLLPVKEQRPIILQKNIQNIAILPVKSDIKPAAVNTAETKKETNYKPIQNAVDTKAKSINNNHAPVPFGKWTEANRQDFLNKIKESKVPVNISNANQIKQPNDLNRRDVLKKIDSQRQTYNANVKIQESLQKGNIKTEAAFASKITPTTVPKRETKVPLKSEAPVVKSKPILIKKPVQETVQQVSIEPTTTATVSSSTTKKEMQRKEINNQDLIDKTIEGIINRAVTGKNQEDVKQTVTEKPTVEKLDKKPEQKTNSQPTLLDAIEMKMNELHGIPFVERPPHELPRPYMTESKISPKTEIQNLPQKVSKIPNLLPLTKSQQKLKDSENDIINLETPKEKSAVLASVPSKSTEKLLAKSPPTFENTKANKDKIITEKEFDKFARRNSVTYENCLTVTDSHQVIQTVVPREAPPKKISRNEQMLAEAKAKSPHKHLPIKQYHPSKAASKYIPVADIQNKQYQSKLQLAYQTAITAKRRIDSPITIIEDKPVKVVYLDSNVPEFTATQLNVQGRDLSPAKRLEPDAVTVGTGDSLDSDILEALDEVRSQDETKTKTKHQRKQVLTPVETPDLELIEPGDLGIEISPKKKRKTEDKSERGVKNLVPKKSYLLGRSAAPTQPNSDIPTNIPPREVNLPNPIPAVTHNDAVSAIDNLVKAAELLENQSEALNTSSTSVQSVDSPQSTPVKRGRGRPRKNPLPDGPDNKVSPQKKPRLIDAKPKHISSSEEDSSEDDIMIKENWTMGKINEKIVCPICNKLFRSENVVFKHVKHCAGPSPSRSDSDKRSPRRSRLSRESETKSRGSRHEDHDDTDLSPVRKTPSKRKSKDSGKSSSSDDVIPIEPKEDNDSHKKNESRKTIKPKTNLRTSNLVCEICGKSFRQLSYLVSHKLQHKKEDTKKPSNEPQTTDKSVFSCETCKKEFRKLHHLVQHRLIHNPVQSRALRKTSSEQKELPKNQETSKVEDQSAGFRCEPCDKSFRKLHHLVEHRETHDGINRQRSNSVTQVNPEKEKPTPPPQCDICKKTFRKLHHLIEHKEQHLETSSEKSDDQKSVKSSLSTKDIIHECNLCYMVFPNEHSLNKHAVNCLRKKKQSAAKKVETQEDKNAEDSAKADLPKDDKEDIVKDPQPVDTDEKEKVEKLPEKPVEPPAKIEVSQIKEDSPKPEVEKTVENIPKPVDKIEKPINEPKLPFEKKTAPVPENLTQKALNKPAETTKIKQVDEIIVIEDTPKKKVPSKDKVAPTVTKRPKVVATAVVEERTAPAASSDEDDVRYMLNPDFKAEETVESKNFMKVRAKKRSSLQIERPNSKDLARRRSLLQHPPKIPRLRAKSDDVVTSTNPPPKPAIKPKLEKVEVPSTDSDDSDVKYSFPKAVTDKPTVSAKQEPETEKKRRKTIAEKRKSLGVIAKRKSLGKAIVKPAAKQSPKPIKRRTLAAEHRCDCGQLFSSAALLARHTTLAHTPPRVRRRRDSPPPKPTLLRKSSARSDANDKPTRKSGAKLPETVKKTAKSRNRVHGGVPLPEKRGSRK